MMSQRVEAWAGTPQSIYTDHFMGTQPLDGPIGFKLEVPPLHPVIFAQAALGFGREQADIMSAFPHTHMLLALLRDGFHEQAAGGQVKLRSDGSAVLDYALTDFVMAGARRALLAMMEIQFAAGARRVLPMHELARPYTSWEEGKQALAALPMKPLLTKVMSAHVMGGCAMANNETLGVTRPDGVHWQLDNLSIHDASIFPTSIGANPQLSIYGMVNRLTQGLVKRLGGQAVVLA
jgi:choline dehydrogenase-like flavoprotein